MCQEKSDSSIQLDDKPTSTVELGAVINCKQLNVREEPNASATVVCVIPFQSEVVIDKDNSTDDFYKVFTVVGIEGFCMRRFIDILQ